MRLVLDTNVLVSGMIRGDGHPGRIVDMVRTGKAQLAVDDRILAEYADVLRRDYLRRYFSDVDTENVIEFLRYGSHHVVSNVVAPALPDAGDIPFLEVALTENLPLVSGNKRHYPSALSRGCMVLSPKEFIERFLANP